MKIPTSESDSRAACRRGFTLVEILVAIGLMAAVLLVTYTIFATTSGAIRVSLARSSILETAYTAETRLRMDFSAMMGPNRAAGLPAGAIVIVPAMRTGALPVPGREGRKKLTQLRSDQIAFFYDRSSGGLLKGNFDGVNPAPPLLRSLTRAGIQSSQARIWLGHVQNAQGETLCDQCTDAAGTSVSGIQDATQWNLGRQAVLLVSSGNGTPATLDATTALSPANPGAGSDDVAPYSLSEVAGWMRAPGRTATEMETALAVVPGDPNNYANQPTVNIQPLADGVYDQGDIVSGYRHFLANCSEFIVQYSTDNRPGTGPKDGLPHAYNGMIDTDGADDYSGNVVWSPSDQDVFDATRPGHAAAMSPVVFYPQDDQVRVWHLGYYQGPNGVDANYPGSLAGQYYTNRFGDVTPYPPQGGFQFGDAITDADGNGDGGAGEYAAAMAAYARLHNNFFPSPAVPPPQSRWPRLIRIRYRLHDSLAQVTSVASELATNGRDDDVDGTVDGDHRGQVQRHVVRARVLHPVPHAMTACGRVPRPSPVSPTPLGESPCTPAPFPPSDPQPARAASRS